MRRSYLLIIALCVTCALDRSAHGEDLNAYSSQIREGMSISDVVAALGRPKDRIEMESKRETLLIYPKRSLKFSEGHLVLELASEKVPMIGSESESGNRASSASNSSDSQLKPPPRPTNTVKLETVLSEVMRSKSNPADSAVMPKVIPLSPGIPGAPVMGGMPPGGIPPGAPYGMQNNLMYNREDSSESTTTAGDDDE